MRTRLDMERALRATPAPAPRSSWDPPSGAGLRRIFENDSVRVTLWRCPKHREANRPTPERSHPRPTMVFLNSGNTFVHSREPAGLLDCTRVAFFNSRVPYHSTHPYGGGDYGSEISLRPEVFGEIVGRFDPRALDCPESPFRMSSGPCPPEAFLLERALVRNLATHGSIDELEVEELAYTLADILVRAASSGSERPKGSAAPSPADRGHAEELRGLLSRRPGARHRLDDLALSLESSPFRLCRVFRATTGTTIHRYLTEVRLRRALVRIADGCDDLTGLALDLGFSSHSHFTATFRKHLGVTPEAVRTVTRAGDFTALRHRLAAIPSAAGN